MAGAVEADLSVRNVALKSLGARRKEEGIILAPHCQQRRPLLAEILLESGVKRDVARVVEEEIELNLVIVRTSEQRGVERVGFWRHEHFIRQAVEVLPPRRLGAQKGAQ